MTGSNFYNAISGTESFYLHVYLVCKFHAFEVWTLEVWKFEVLRVGCWM